VFRHEGPPVWQRLPGSGAGDEWLRSDTQLTGQLRSALPTGAAKAAEVAELVRRLARQRLEPLLPHLQGDRHLVVVPVGWMAGVPVEVLTDRFTISYAPSGTQLLRLLERPRPQVAPTLLAVADPLFAPSKYAELPGTGREAQLLRGLFDQANVLCRAAASASELEALRAAGRLSQYRYLHFATHGEADRGKAFESALILADGRRLTANDILEKWQLDAELVTLSACESGLGPSGGAEGYLGFGQAFLLAGARSVVLSLWQVDDTATALLMQRFYQNLLGKRTDLKAPLTKAEALREAKQWLQTLTSEQVAEKVARLPKLERGGERKRDVKSSDPQRPFAHPYYWSAFILIGDPN
jgi:CHAT domain-containing protein